MNTDRNEYLTEAMGECWHEREYINNQFFNGPGRRCDKCRKYIGTKLMPDSIKKYNNDFSIWQGFGKLWEWAQDQEWWSEFFVSKLTCRETDLININKLINPDRFANAVYEFLKGRDGK